MVDKVEQLTLCTQNNSVPPVHIIIPTLYINVIPVQTMAHKLSNSQRLK